jgi:hypothetical protein
LEELEDEEGGIDMIQMAIDDDPKDLDWIPPSLQMCTQDQVPVAEQKFTLIPEVS